MDPAAYDMIGEDLTWMKVEWDEQIIQSDRMEIYYQQARELIQNGGAYMCTCPGDEFKKLKDSQQSCPHRDATLEENLALWEKMPQTGEGEMVLRVKTDIAHKNPAIRDWVAMRVVEAEHPRLGSKYKVYPMMNFSVSVDDHLLGVTHVLRGKDHLANSEKQEYLYQHMGWETPQFIHYGRLKMEDIHSHIQGTRGYTEGIYSGWRPRLGTIRAIAAEVYRQKYPKLMNEIGVKCRHHGEAGRRSTAWNRAPGGEPTVTSWWNSRASTYRTAESSLKIVERPLHPDHLDRGMRDKIRKASILGRRIYPRIKQVIRLMDAVNITSRWESPDHRVV